MRSIILSPLYLVFLASTTLSGQFGQNIVQYDHYEWQFIQTPQFDIYFYGDDMTIAKFASAAATESYEQISDRLNWQLQKRVSIMVYQSHADFQQTNVTYSYMSEGIGGVTELFKNRVVVPFEGSYADFRHVIHHELVHAMVNDFIYGGNAQSIISGRIRYSIPLWMNEGLAEYLSNGWESNSDMYMRDLALNGDIPPVSQLGGLYAYRGGQSVWRFITSKYGEESIAEIFTQIKNRSNIDRGLKAALGTDLKRLGEQWSENIKKDYWPDVAGRERLEDVAFRVTDHEKIENTYNIAPSISPDGSKLALLANRHGNMEIILISATDGKFIKRLIRGGTTSGFEELHLLKPGITWSPDGSKVAFAAKAASKEMVYVVDIKTNKTKKYPSTLEGVFNAAWSPDGSTIALAANNGTKSDIYLLDLEFGDFTNLTDDIFAEYNPVWSADGNSIAFGSDRGSAPPYRYDADGMEYPIEMRFDPMLGSPLTATPPSFEMDNFDFSGSDIFTMNRDGSQLQRRTFDDAQENFPAFAHSAPYLYYTSDRTGINNVYMLDLETGEERTVTNVLTGVSDLNMAVDDSRLYFSGFQNSGFDIYRFNNPLDLWNQDLQVEPSKYILTESGNRIAERVNENRNRFGHVGSNNYRNYVFGIDDPSDFGTRVATSSLSDMLEEEDLKDQDGEYKVQKYRTRFTLDLVQSYASYNTVYSFQGMTQFVFSDMLGNHRISMATEMQISLENSDYFFTYHFLPYRTNYYFTLFHTALLLQDITGRVDRLRHYGMDFTTSFPIDRFKRIEAGLVATSAIYSQFARNSNNQLQELKDVRQTLTTAIPRLGFVLDNAEWSYLYPLGGWRSSINLQASPKFNNKSLSFTTLSFDIRRYGRLWGGTSFAARVSGGVSTGADAQRFLVGGLPWLMSSDTDGRYKSTPFTNSEEVLKTLYFSQYLTPLRGTQLLEMVAEKAVLLNLEYRFPFLLYYFPALGMLGQIGGVAFIDAAQVWDPVPIGDQPEDDLPKTQTALTYGWGPRFLLFGLPIKIDYAWEYRATGPHPKNWYFTIGLDF
ncbi:MAG: PD40 domain-containing protein [Candidatus Marinimicrobia bacterium]|nr:PD40 domain-containing protein [Candidatus Neomarinimicrobiota bacterium]